MPPPVPGTGLSSHVQDGAPAPMAASNPGISVTEDKSLAVTYLLWFFLGWFGIHHFYLGKVGRGIGYLLTFGWLTLGWWVDLFTLPAQVKRINFERRVGLR
jgi:hypothetical protein